MSSSDPIHEVHQSRLTLFAEIITSIARIKKHKIILEKKLYTVVNSDQARPLELKAHLSTCIYLENKLLNIIDRMQTTIIETIIECQQEMNLYSNTLLKKDITLFEYNTVQRWKYDGTM